MGDKIRLHPVTGDMKVESDNKRNDTGLVAWPTIDGDVSHIRTQVGENDHVNKYIEQKILENAKKLATEGIGNTGTVVMNYEGPYTKPFSIGYSKPMKSNNN